MKNSSRVLSSRQVAEAIGAPYGTLMKWQTRDGLLQPTPGGGGRRGGDRWSRTEAWLASVVADLRRAHVPVDYLRPIIGALRAWRGQKAEVSVYLAVHVRATPDAPEKRVAFFHLRSDGALEDATQLTLF